MSDYDRDYAARKAHERDSLDDAKIQTKITAHHANQFRERYPTQVEHCLRLTMERLQAGLNKDSSRPLTQGETESLALAAEALHNIWLTVK